MNPTSTPFDASHWKRVNQALDQLLELEGSDREAMLATLANEDPPLAAELRRLLARATREVSTANLARTITPDLAVSDALKTALVRPGLTTALSTVFRTGSPMAEHGFDGLLQRALRAERAVAKSARQRGDLCGAWRLQSVIGTGGMGEVWLAERADGLYEAKAAVKFLRAETNVEAFEARFAQERALLARLNHPGIAHLLDAGRQRGHPFLVLEYVEGMSVLNYLVENAHTLAQRLAVFRAIVEAVSYAHSQLVVHRDLKPSNVLVTPSGQVKLLDFGVAGLLNQDDHDHTTQSNATRIAGRGMTIEYAAPEQITGDATGVASDIYSLGALGYHLLSGHRAHLLEKPGRAALEHAILHIDAARLSVAARHKPIESRDNIAPVSDVARINADLDAIFARALRREPEARYRTAVELLSDLQRFSEHRPIAARREDRSYRAKLWLRRNWLSASLALTLLLALAGGFAASLWQAERAKDEAARANKTADYLVELLSGADPDLHGGNWPTVLNLIERAERDVGSKFKDEPSVEQKLSQNVATTLRRLSRFQDAYPIAKRSYVLSQTLYGSDAESTRIAAALLADILYWLDRDDEAPPLVDQALGKSRPEPMPEWWREAFLLRANLISGKRQFAESHAQFDQYREHIRGHPHERWFEAEAETDRALSLMAEGRHRESLAIFHRYRDALDNPPEHASKRIALTNLNNGDVMRLEMGEFDGLEAAFRKNLAQWDRLAGPLNRHSIEAVGRLAFFYYQHNRPLEARAQFGEKLKRLQSLKIAEPAQEWFVRIDTLENDTRYFMRDAATILTEARIIEREIQTSAARDNPASARYLQRLAMVRATFGDFTGLAATLPNALPPLANANERADRAQTRWLAVATLLSGAGKSREACDALRFAADHFGAANRALVALSLYLRTALFCALAGEADAARFLARARSITPDSLPANHRLRKVTAHVAQVVQQQGKDIAASQRKLAEALETPEIETLPPPLHGLVF